MLKKSVVIIPIYRPDDKFKKLLAMLRQQKEVYFDVYIVDSGSHAEDYLNELDGLSYTIVKTTPQDFNHGGTRQAAAEACKDYQYLIYMTQDAIPVNEFTLHNLLKAFENPKVGCAYGRQLPHKDATILAARARAFNYPPESRLKGIADAPELGIKVSFISDTFAAYRPEVLKEIGGFPSDVILGEDTYVASKMVLAGWLNAYVADAQVYHSHNYTIMQEFRRYFDTGVFHARESWIQQAFGKAEGEGKKFVIDELRFLAKNKPLLVFSTILRDGFKLLGYKLGLHEKLIPMSIKKQCSMTPKYWK
ncbi:glycosyltransferase family 2 protein [Megasphaera sp.]|uniref:glycosyltransferase family 2 protein n=1 Tax=Megasphaera sp. TaxID=2023260 RepID=UPI0027BB073A|nr:glycosyltransferase [Megasphaera sp.]